MLGVTARPRVLPDEYLMPVEAHGLATLSPGSERGNCASIRTWLSYQYLPAVLKTQLVSTIRQRSGVQPSGESRS